MTSPFKVIRGTDKNINEFEQAISDAMLSGYELAGDLVVSSNGSETLLFQTMVQEEEYAFDEDEEIDEEDDDEEEEEEEEEEDYEEDDEEDNQEIDFGTDLDFEVDEDDV